MLAKRQFAAAQLQPFLWQTVALAGAHAPRASDGACGNYTAVHLVAVPQLTKFIPAKGVALAVLGDADCVARAGPLDN